MTLLYGVVRSTANSGGIATTSLSVWPFGIACQSAAGSDGTSLEVVQVFQKELKRLPTLPSRRFHFLRDICRSKCLTRQGKLNLENYHNKSLKKASSYALLGTLLQQMRCCFRRQLLPGRLEAKSCVHSTTVSTSQS